MAKRAFHPVSQDRHHLLALVQINQALHELLAEQHLQFEIDAKLRLTDCLAQFGLIDLTRADHQADAAKPAESSATSRRGQSLWDMISDAMLPAEPAKLADVVLANASSGPLPKMQSSALADSASANGQFKLKMLKPTGSFLVPDTMKQDSNLTKKPNGATNLQDARRASALPRMFDGDSSSEVLHTENCHCHVPHKGGETTWLLIGCYVIVTILCGATVADS